MNYLKSELINPLNTNGQPLTSTLDATYRSPNVATVSCPGVSNKMTGGYTYKKKRTKGKRTRNQTKNTFIFNSPGQIVGGRHKRRGRHSRKTKRRGGKSGNKYYSRARMIGMSLAKGRTVAGGNGSGFPTGYSLAGNVNTLSGALASPPPYTAYSHGLIPQNV